MQGLQGLKVRKRERPIHFCKCGGKGNLKPGEWRSSFQRAVVRDIARCFASHRIALKEILISESDAREDGCITVTGSGRDVHTLPAIRTSAHRVSVMTIITGILS